MKMVRFWVVVAGLVIICGCDQQQLNFQPQPLFTAALSDANSEVAAQKQSPILDIPVPAGVRLDQEYSRDYNLGGSRLVDHLYRGRGDKFALKRFYEREMPSNGWKLLYGRHAESDVEIEFEKASERCRVVVTSGNLINPIVIKVKVWTSGQVAPAAAQLRR